MTNEQLAAYLEMLTERLSGIRGRLNISLKNANLERHPETYNADIPFLDAKIKPHPRADQPVCLDELADLIVELRHRTRLLVEKPKSQSIAEQYKTTLGSWGS